MNGVSSYPPTEGAPANDWYASAGGSIYTVDLGKGITSLNFFPPCGPMGAKFSLDNLTETDVRGLIAILQARLPLPAESPPPEQPA